MKAGEPATAAELLGAVVLSTAEFQMRTPGTISLRNGWGGAFELHYDEAGYRDVPQLYMPMATSPHVNGGTYRVVLAVVKVAP